MKKLSLLFIFFLIFIYLYSCKTTSMPQPVYTYGYINTRGTLVIPYQYKRASAFSEGLAFVTGTDSTGYIDTTGELAIPLENGVGGSFSQGLAPVAQFIEWEGNTQIFL